MDNSSKLRKDTVMLVRLENCVHQSKFQGPANGPMENAGGFLIIPAPSWWRSPEGERPFLPPLPPPPIPTLELTQKGGGRPVDPGGGRAGESPGGARGAELILKRSSQRADGKSL